MKPNALVMAIVVVAVGVGTYFALGFVPPGIIPGVNVPNEETDELEVPPIEFTRAIPSDAAGAGAADNGEPGDEGGSDDMGEETGSDEASGDTDAAAASTDYASSEEIERALANEPPPDDTAAPAPAAKKDAPAAADATAQEETQETAAAEEPPPAPRTAERKPAPKPAPEPVKTAATESPPTPAPRPTSPPPAGPDAIKRWWPDASSMPDNQLKLIYAGQVKGQLAIALLFSDKLKIDTLRDNAQVKTADGSSAQGEWQLGNNPKLAIYTGIEPGRYTVVLAPRITGESGFMLGTKLQGPVYVKAP